MNCFKRQLICSAIIFSSLLSISVSAQSLEQTFEFANRMKQEGNYETAIKYFQRVSFFGGDYKITECYTGTADCYFMLNDFKQAENFYELAFFSTDSDSLQDLLALSRAAIFIYDKKYLEALQELYSTSDKSEFSVTKNIYLATAYYGLNRFEDSKQALMKVVKDSTQSDELNHLFKKAMRIQKRNPKTARMLSMFVPGLGQFYSGDVKDGINSLVITMAFMYLTVNTAMNYSLLEATSVLPWFSRYYMGGYKRAETIAINRIEDLQFKIFTQIMSVVQEK